MKKLIVAAAVVAALAAAPAAQAAPTLLYDFQLNGTFADALGSSVTLTGLGGSFQNYLGSDVYAFNAGSGVVLEDVLAGSGSYQVEMRFALTETDGYRRLLDFLDRQNDSGLYNLSTTLDLFPQGNSAPGAFTADTYATLLFSRRASGRYHGFVDGNLVLTGVDEPNETQIVNDLTFFADNIAGNAQGEHSGGVLDYVRISSGVVPEPSTWAMMILGFGAAGSLIRRRRAAGACP